MKNQKETWLQLDEVDFSDESIKAIHCDTRDFGCILKDEYKDDTLPDLTKVKKYKDRFFFTAEEIEKILKDLYKKSGGKKKWRLLMFEDPGDPELVWGGHWEFKYLRFFKTEDGWVLKQKNFERVTKKEILTYPIYSQ